MLPKLLQERDRLKEELKGAQEAERQAKALAQMAREERDVAKVDEGRLRAQRDRAVEESRRARAEKEQLQSRVTLLQERCEHLARGVRSAFLLPSMLNPAAVKQQTQLVFLISRPPISQAAPSSRQESKQDEEKAASPPDSIDSSWQVVNLDESLPLVSDGTPNIDW